MRNLENEKARVVPLLDVFMVITITFFLVLLLGFLFLVILGEGLALVLSELLVLIVPLSYMLIKRIDIKTYIGLKFQPKFLILGLVSSILILFLDIVVSILLTSIFGVSEAVEQSNALILNLSSSTPGLITVIAALSLAGFCEEFAFRGFLQTTLNRKYSFIPAVLISSITFGLFHFDLQVVYTFSAIAAGLALGLIYHRWKSYLTVAVAHSTVNLMVLVAVLLLM